MGFTGSTGGVAAGAQTNDARIDYALEATYGVSPTTAYQALRITGETLRIAQTTSRPDEINGIPEVSQSVETQRQASGTISGALSAGTFDDLMVAVMGADWANGAITNGTLEKTFTVRRKILGKFVHYPGALVSQFQIQLQQGQYGSVSTDLLCKDEVVSDADIASVVVDAPSGKVLNTVSNFVSASINGATPQGCVTQATITLSRDGAANDYGMGHADACGARIGRFMAAGSIAYYFRSWEQYQAALAGTQGPIAITVKDDDGDGYEFRFLNAALRNPQVNVNQSNQTVTVNFTIEGNPAANGGTFTITKIAPAAPPAGG